MTTSSNASTIYVVLSQPDLIKGGQIHPVCYFQDYPSALAYAKLIFRKFTRPSDPRDMVFMVDQGPASSTSPSVTQPVTTPTTNATPLTSS